jgi:hypothetical protein
MDHRRAKQGATFFGNVGRCLYLLGRLREARLCYARSADLLYEASDKISIANQGWAGLWIGDVCVRDGDTTLATLFYQDCKNVWSVRAPLLLQKLDESLAAAPPGIREQVARSDADVRSMCRTRVQEWLALT